MRLPWMEGWPPGCHVQPQVPTGLSLLSPEGWITPVLCVGTLRLSGLTCPQIMGKHRGPAPPDSCRHESLALIWWGFQLECGSDELLEARRFAFYPELAQLPLLL